MSVAPSAIALLIFLPLFSGAQSSAERIASNDNRRPAGILRNGILKLDLEIRNGRWYPESDTGASVTIHAFAEAGKLPSNPGPLIRVPEGTEILLTLRNNLEKEETRVFGLHMRPERNDPGILVPAKGSASVRFKAGAAGTYYYWGTTRTNGFGRRAAESQLSGAFIIDPALPARMPSDRIFVIGMWRESVSVVNGVEQPRREVFVINGKSWPHTERFELTVGDTVTWRWVNPTPATHPMHLHGFYYNVTSIGGLGDDDVYQPRDYRLVNTELMRVGGTMATTWVPEKPGNWLFHCHFAFHVSGENTLTPAPKAASNGDHSHGAMPHKMAGLALGIHVKPRPGESIAQSKEPVRDMRLLLQTSPKRFADKAAYGFVLQDGSSIPRIDSVAMPGPTLLLKRGQPVRITMVNNLDESSAIHWHGIELESFPDGVPNWSGMGTKLMVPIAPKDSFVAEFTPPRAGTFMYHSHLNEGMQMNSGMYGALIVTDDPAKFDASKEKIILVGGGGPAPLGGDTPGFVNGSADPQPLRMEVGTTYRLRLINIHPDWRVEFTLGNDTTIAQWRPVAKDGADLPASQMAVRHAYLLTGPGETADFEYTPTQPGNLRLQVRTRAPGWNVPVNVIVMEPKKTVAAERQD
jgi:FtsP/CotA-like multicopper oxidase with cupredoxin domain